MVLKICGVAINAFYKVVFLRTYLGKSFDPKIHKNYPGEINEFYRAVFVSDDFPKYIRFLKNRL